MDNLEIKKQKMLIVDDLQVSRTLLSMMFEEQYEIIEAADGVEAMKAIKEYYDDLVIVLLDLVMPNMDGLAVLVKMQEMNLLEQLPVILITAEDDVESTKKAYEYGVSDVIHKPFDSYIVMRRTQNVIDLYMSKRNIQEQLVVQERKLHEKNKELKENNEFLVDALSSVVEFRSVESGLHIKRIRYFTKILLVAMMDLYPECGLTTKDIDRIVMAAALHDVGKVGISDEILLKPGRLTDEEFEIMKSHTTIGGEIIQKFTKNKKSQFYKDCYEICMYHHERYDGKGYPEGLVGEDIPLSAQAVAVADVFDALVSKRVYKTPLAPEYAFDMINNGECGEFSPRILKCFNATHSEFFVMAEQMDYTDYTSTETE